MSVYLGPIPEENLPLIADLNKQATACKKDGDWKGAIAALREAKKLSGQWYDDTKLALYLQQAGQFGASMKEFQWLLDHCLKQCQRSFGHNGNSTVMAQYAGKCMRIHAKAALAAQREKNVELEQFHIDKGQEYDAMLPRLKALAEDERATKRQEWEAASQAGAEAMRAFFKKYPSASNRKSA